MPFAASVKEEVLVACGRHCCICHRFCGLKIEVHHIVAPGDGGTDESDNAIPLCFDCHADMRSADHRHPKGNKYSPSELRRHRDAWYGRVAANPGLATVQATHESDKRVYERLTSILPWATTIMFLRRHHFRYPYERAALDDLYTFRWECGDPAFEFLHPDLEGLRAELAAHIDAFLDAIGETTFSMDGYPERSSVPIDWQYTEAGLFQSAVRTLNSEAEAITEAYDRVVRSARRILGVLPSDGGQEASPP